ncbi:MAG: AraC family transcriptional regulator [Verrucomicrobiota bacterium]
MDTTVTLIQGGNTRCTPANWRGSGEWCDVAKLYAPTAGTAWVAVDGRRTMLHPGQLYLIPPHHRLTHGTDKEFVVDWLHFQPLSSLLDARLSKLAAVQSFANRWSPITMALAEFFRQPTPSMTCRVQALVLDVVGETLERIPAESGRGERLLPALRFMDDHVTTAPRLAAIARKVNLSPEHFHRLFREQFQTTPFEYLLRRRLAKAHRLLLEGGLSVKEVAAACGYDDPYYFSRIFRQRQGATPRDVRLGKAAHHP